MVLDIISVCLLVVTIFLLLFLIFKNKIFCNNKDINSSNLDVSNLGNEVSRNLNQEFNSISSLLNKSISDLRADVTKALGDSKSESNEDHVRTQADIQDKFRAFQVNFEQRIAEMNVSIEKRLLSINDRVDERLNTGFEKTNESFNKISITVAKIEEAKKTMDQLTGEVNELQNILSNNQTRGAFGEYQLNQILANIFGEFQGKMYDIQYEIEKSDGKVRADAVIHLVQQGLILCIDSKFPYSSYADYASKRFDSDSEENKALNLIKKDVKEHIDVISAKYVIPGITLDYALMFVPSDGLLSLLHAKIPQIIEYATSKGVVIVSPTIAVPTLLSCKAMIIDSMKAEKLRELNNILIGLSKEFGAFGETWRKLNKNLNTVHKQSHDFNVKVNKITRKFNNLQVSIIEELEYEEVEYDDEIEEDDEV